MSALDRLAELDAPTRLAQRDPSLFSADAAVQAEVADNLGWTALAADAAAALPAVEALASQLAEEGLTDVVLLGMGGSSLASLVIGSVLATSPSGPRLHVMDTTSPVTVAAKLAELDFSTSVFLVSSKSGTTIEPLSLYAIFRDAADAALGRQQAGSRFVAITDPGSFLETLAADDGFRTVVSSPPTVGGRYSALTAFGLVPAALLGIDLKRLLSPARAMEAACALAAAENPGAQLAAFAVDAHASGRDKLTIIASPGLGTFGLWVEQLVAESLGKEGTGILPVVDLSADKPFALGADRALAIVRFADDDRLAGWAAEWRAHFPVVELVLADAYDLGAEFVRWEHAVALMGPLLGVNPFGQPNVAAAKAATSAVLEGAMAAPEWTTEADGAALTFAGALPDPGHPESGLGTALGHVVASLRAGDYLAVLAYLPDDDALLRELRVVVAPASAELGVPITFELGPRYLHSTGQLHKGGPDNGVFVLVTTSETADVAVPGKPWGLRALHRAQAEGDLVTLTQAGRRVLRIDLPDAAPASIALLARGLADAAGIVIEER